jgi:hypothetical protein
MADVDRSDWMDEEPRRSVRHRITHYITAAYRGTIPLISSCFNGSRRNEDGLLVYLCTIFFGFEPDPR